ncbi:pyruvate dehydrogenase E1 component alpha subunit [Microbacterium sp. AG157]|uniref:Pyruvate dehydrogenase E1 component alpha subunit n=1 Tax=Microbacterium testaceum TaxID=2033 RepID=A0A4Y3QMA3_MICTE|nr:MULTISPECIES: pyruvate dehydrogenase (acetyl-transferring) E1 component subunit alpha [Microbacterium]PNW08870.1 pyruvate dehydrogenase (acetyl-transferring) E1 component subunit alpha [Microbacterium testaceum]REC96777.1 pyruvate dehydrogenase E1 component alpha subunit [Microbacterium sp. AG157]WJS92294.1 pyruvate dehydrogenase (acetyl-transferring) E1 component subunit alpha [Microbacterium testaceum]GEB45793.1 pyruvate dehydrogenase E1 component alpha subunit [Microbacterium testaceum]
MTYTQTRGTSPGSADEHDGVDDVLRLLEPDGSRIADDTLDPWVADVSPHELRALHRDMVLTRRLDAEGVALQRQGQLALWAPCRGQEATQVGTAHALAPGDFVFPSYREHGVLLGRGAQPADYVLAWRGEEHSAYDHTTINAAPPQIIIGAQSLHATGWAMGAQRDGSTDVAVAYYGDGATSQGDVNEAMVFASSFRAPVVFVCSNNQWAISEPVTVQAKYPIAGRAPGFGIPSLRIDGNDALACVAAMRWALDRARRGEGPSFLEAVTYRMGPHTTSDDPTRYRDAAEVEEWAQRDPIARLEAYLRAEGMLDDSGMAEVDRAADALAAEVRAACIGATTRAPETMFDHVYAEPHSGLAQQKAEYVEYLAGFEK